VCCGSYNHFVRAVCLHLHHEDNSHLQLALRNSVSWCTAEAANQMKGHRGFSMYVMEATLKLLKAFEAENHGILKSTSRLNSYINIGR
jgi:hypothetical protein